MGILKKALKNITAEDVASAQKGGAFGVDEGGYVCQITGASITEIQKGDNAGMPQIMLEVKPVENWDGDTVRGPHIKAWIPLASHWASGSVNFTLLQFLAAIDGWDAEENEPTFDFKDESDLEEQLLGEEIKAQIGYRESRPSAEHPKIRVFNEVSRWLAPDADLVAGRKTFEEAMAEVEAKSNEVTTKATGDTTRKWTIGGKN